MALRFFWPVLPRMINSLFCAWWDACALCFPGKSENKIMADGPIYIGGLDRCGKTTMQAFLSSHPRIAIPHVGSNLWRYFYGQYGDLAYKANFERCLRAMLAYSHVQALNP